MRDIAVHENDFRCEICNGVFRKVGTEYQSLVEKIRDFPDVPVEDCSIVCDRCHQDFMAWLRDRNENTLRAQQGNMGPVR